MQGETAVEQVALIDLFYADGEWAKLRRAGAVEFVSRRLAALSGCLGDKPFLDGDRFTAGDLPAIRGSRIMSNAARHGQPSDARSLRKWGTSGSLLNQRVRRLRDGTPCGGVDVPSWLV
jgi:glutathione S-transferase